jgi:hypothetical protein
MVRIYQISSVVAVGRRAVGSAFELLLGVFFDAHCKSRLYHHQWQGSCRVLLNWGWRSGGNAFGVLLYALETFHLALREQAVPIQDLIAMLL